MCYIFTALLLALIIILLFFKFLGCIIFISSPFFLMVLIHALDDFCSSERLGCFINNNAHVVLNKYV